MRFFDKWASRAASAAQALAVAATDVSTAVMYGIRDAMRPGLLTLSFFIGMAFAVFWSVIFYVFWVELLTLNGFLVGIVVREAVIDLLKDSGLWGWAGFDKSATSVTGLNPVTMVVGWGAALGGTVFGTVVTVMVTVLELAVVILLSHRVFLELFLMSWIQRLCLRRYPAIRPVNQGMLLSSLRDTVGTLTTLVVGVLLCYVLPLFGGLALFLLISYLNIRGLLADALDGVVSPVELRGVVEANRVQMTLLGVLMTFLTIIPVVGFLVPALLGTCTCHLALRSLIDLRGKTVNPVVTLPARPVAVAD